MKYYIGIDLGGTNIVAGVVDENYNIISKASTKTNLPRPEKEIADDMAKVSVQAVKEAGISMEQIEWVGIGTPGIANSEKGIIEYSCNLGFNNTPMVEYIKKSIDKPVFIENDANAAAYGEYIVNGGGVDSFVAITLGTGVGGGIVLDKKIYRGFNGAGGEIGHFTLVHGGEPCTCGNCGCWESYASVTALIRQTERAVEQHPDSLMVKYLKEDGHASGRTAFEAAKAGDSAAQAVVNQYLEYVADGLNSVVNIFQPEILVIGGGISREGDYLLKPVQAYIEKHVYSRDVPQTTLKIATLFNDAGIIGAALASTAQ